MLRSGIGDLSCIGMSTIAKIQQQEVVICLQVQIKCITCWNLVCLLFGPLNLTRVLCWVHRNVWSRRPNGKPTSLSQPQICFYLFTSSVRTQSSRDVAAKQGFLFSLTFLALSAGKSGLAVVCWMLPRHIYPWHGLRHNIYCLLIGCGETQACPPWESSWDIQ